MYIFYNRKRGYYVTGSFTDRLLKFIHIEGVNQNTFQKQTKINEGLLSRYKNAKCDLGLLDREALDKFLLSKGY